MANSSEDTAPALPTLLGHLQVVAAVVAAILLSAVVAVHALFFFWGVANVGLAAVITMIAPALSLLLMTAGNYLNYYGTWRILRRKATYDVHEDLKSHAADIPYALSQLGCLSLISPLLLAASLLATGLTYAPQPLGVLGIATGLTPPATSTPMPMPTLTSIPAVSTPTPVPTVPPTPTPRPTAIPPNANLKVTQNQNASESCSGSPAPAYTVTLDNTGSNVSVGWQFSASAGWAGASPSGGTVTAGKTATVQVTPSVCPLPGLSNTYQATLSLSFPQGGSQGNITLKDTITGPAPIANLTVTQNQNYPAVPPDTCGFFGASFFPPSTYAVTLHNSGNVPVGWQFVPQEYSGVTPWANANPTSGTLAPGASTQFTVTPNAWACPATIDVPVTYHASLQLSFPQGGSEGNPSLTDQIEQVPIIG